MTTQKAFVFVFFAALIANPFFFMGCTALKGGKTGQNSAFAEQTFPSTYTGVLPCADCEGIRYTLNLWGDNVFFLRMTYLGKGQGEGDSFDDIGVWTLSGDKARLVLQGGREAPVLFAVKSAERLSKLDLKGQEILSQLNYDLLRQARFEWFEPRLLLRGMYRYMADAGLFTECLTGRKLPVAQEGDNAALERAYLKARNQPGEPLLVNLEGRMAMRPRMEGPGQQEMLVVERFIRVLPGETCGPQFSAVPLEKTYWKLVRLGNQPVMVRPNRREPHVQLSPEGMRVQGFGGCNRFFGSYALEGQALRFDKMGMTRMACADGMEQEQAFMKALESTVRWNILGEHLELYDVQGKLLARFESRYFE
jgi:copper homeostasis protein (lipoprotein)